MVTATAAAEARAAVEAAPATPWWAAPVSSAWLEVVRIVYGLAGAAAAGRFLARGWVGALHLAPEHHLTYPGFDWVRPLPAPGAHLHLLIVALAGVAVAAGYRTKAALAVFVAGFLWLELIDAALYLNHYWLLTLLGLLLLALPIGGRWSLDVRARRVEPTSTVGRWAVVAVQAQLAAVYLFAGLGKLQGDWLVHAQPMRLWLADRTDRLLVGPWLDDAWVAYLASWAGAAFDCTIVVWLLWRRSRPWAYAVLVVFHVATAALFQIGLFPWMMIALTVVFFATPARASSAPGPVSSRPGRAAAVALAALAGVNLVVPLRHLAYPGDVAVTEEGYYGSFRVMLTEKGGWVTFLVTDPLTGDTWSVDPAELYEPWQVSQLTVRPDLLLTAAHTVAAEAREAGHARVEVRADAWVSVNGRPRQRLVDPTVDLAAIQRRFR